MPEIGKSRLHKLDIGRDGIIKFKHHTLATNPILQSRVVGDVDPRFQIRADGRLRWGGGSAGGEVELFRSGFGVLKTGDRFYVENNLVELTAAGAGDTYLKMRRAIESESRIRFLGSGVVQFGSGAVAEDVGFYRSGANAMDIEVNAVDAFRISNTAVAKDTFLMIHDVDNNKLERVTVGAADSGGAGKKVLCIPN